MIDLTGQIFGYLKVIGFSHRHRNTYWKCLCDCGNNIVVRGSSLKNGHTKSCSCLRIERNKEQKTKHGRYGSKEYITWSNMKKRCMNSKSPNYKDYGGRGIKICKRWEEFENFYVDMGDRPEGKSIDRIDNDGNYTPKNCKWSTHTEQMNNRRNNIL